MNQHGKINYAEFPASNIKATKSFYTAAFGWEFVDYGPDYISVSDAGIGVGFYHSKLVASTDTGSVLIVFFSDSLQKTQQKIEQAGGKIVKPIFDFPGGRRFHFSDPNGNELAAWSDV